MSEERRLRDPIHGFIRLSGDEADIVETEVFQRLRGIRQLAMANMVYPGALHTRFDHTLGVFHVTSLLSDLFSFSAEDKQDYLLRDTYFCGVKYGVFDLQQLHRELLEIDDPADGKRLAITADGVH